MEPTMINLEFIMQPGLPHVMCYDVHPASQQTAIPIPYGAYGVVVWLGTVALGEYEIEIGASDDADPLL
jgi:hypothetical protein